MPTVNKAKTTKARALTPGTTAVYRGGSRSKKLRRGERVTLVARAANKNGTWRYGVRTARGFRTWLSATHLRATS